MQMSGNIWSSKFIWFMDIIYYQSHSFFEVLSMVAQQECYIFCEKTILLLYLHTCPSCFSCCRVSGEDDLPRSWEGKGSGSVTSSFSSFTSTGRNGQCFAVLWVFVFYLPSCMQSQKSKTGLVITSMLHKKTVNKLSLVWRAQSILRCSKDAANRCVTIHVYTNTLSHT